MGDTAPYDLKIQTYYLFEHIKIHKTKKKSKEKIDAKQESKRNKCGNKKSSSSKLLNC